MFCGIVCVLPWTSFDRGRRSATEVNIDCIVLVQLGPVTVKQQEEEQQIKQEEEQQIKQEENKRIENCVNINV